MNWQYGIGKDDDNGDIDANGDEKRQRNEGDEDNGDEDNGDDINGDRYQWQPPMTDVAVIRRRRWQEDINVGNGVDQNANDEHHWGKFGTHRLPRRQQPDDRGPDAVKFQSHKVK